MRCRVLRNPEPTRVPGFWERKPEPDTPTACDVVNGLNYARVVFQQPFELQYFLEASFFHARILFALGVQYVLANLLLLSTLFVNVSSLSCYNLGSVLINQLY